MASIASPRVIPASGASTPTISSRRTSLDTTRTSSPARAPAPAPAGPHARRNRTALRDYYNLKPQAASSVSGVPSSSASVASEDTSIAPDSELDKTDFDAAAYVQGILEKEGLAAVLRTEGALLNEIRELDGERKALVYDNYSKLIAATDTIRGMRANMAPLDASTGDLKGMVGRIAETAEELSGTASEQNSATRREEAHRAGEHDLDKAKRQRNTVKWVVGSPARLERLVADGKRTEAETEWAKVSALLDKWKGVQGVQTIRDQCTDILGRDSSDAKD